MRDVLLILHFLGLAMGLGSSFAFMFLGLAASKMEKDEAREFSLKALSVGRLGHIGVGLLIISGFGLMTPFWKSLAQMHLLHIKFTLVAVLVTLIIILASLAKKAKNSDPDLYLKKMQMYGKGALLTAISIVILAVYTFH